MGKLIAITGTPGTGKTTLAKRLEEEGIGKRITELVIEKCTVGYDESLETKIVDEEKIREFLRNFLKENEGLFIFDSHLAHYSPKEFTILYVLLRCDPNKLKERLKNRGWDDFKIKMNVYAEAYNLIKNEMDDMGIEYVEFWTDKMSLDEIVNKIKEILVRKVCLKE